MSARPGQRVLWSYAECAAFLDITPAAVRRLAALARASIGAHPFPAPEPTRGGQVRYDPAKVRAYAQSRPGRGNRRAAS